MEGGEGGMDGGEGGMEGRGRGRMGAGPHRRVMAVTRCVFLVVYLCCRLVFVCPRCGALIPCSRRRVLVLCCCCASSLYVVVAHNRQRQTTTNVIIHHLVPDVSELGWDGMGGGGAYCGVVSSFVIWVPCRSSNMAPGFRSWVLVVFVVAAAISVHVGIHSCWFWGVCCCLGGRHCCLGGRTMTNDGFKSIVHQLVATIYMM